MIVITGGAGFIGSAFCWELNRQGQKDIVLVDHLGTSEKWKNLVGLQFADYLEKDVFLSRAQSDSLGFKPTWIIHMGACSSTTESDASYLIANNFDYSKELAKYCVKNGVKLMYASSAATYGDGSNGYSDRCNLRELKPLNMYGYSKHMFDQWLKAQGLLDQMVGLKFFNVWGPNEYHKGSMKSMVVKAWEQIRETGRVKLFKSYHESYEDGKQMRDFIYVKDVTRMMLQLMNHPDAGGLYNLGNGEAATWIDLISPIFSALDRQLAIDFIPMPEELRDKYQYYTRADMTRYVETGLPRYNTTMTEAVHDFVLNYLEKDAYLES